MQWCAFHDLPGDEVAVFWRLIREMDAEYADYEAGQRKQQMEPG